VKFSLATIALVATSLHADEWLERPVDDTTYQTETGHRGAACPANYIGRIGPRPLFTINSVNDGDQDAERSVRPLHRLIHPTTPHESRWTRGGHSYAGEDDWAAMFEWLRKTVSSKASE